MKRSKRGRARVVWLFVILAVTAVALAALIARPRPLLQESGGTLRLGALGGPPATINPVLTDRTISQPMLQLIFNSLVRLNNQMLPEPDLSESWEVSADGLVYTFHIRKGVRFHDGVELTAEDVCFTYELITDPVVNSPWRSYYSTVKSWQAVDKSTFRVTLSQPWTLNISGMTEGIVPRHLLKGKDIRSADFNRRPIGSGPFRFAELTTDNKIILEANPDYYEGRPGIDRVIATGYADAGQFWAAFMHDEVDLIFFLSRERFEIAQRDTAFRTYTFSYPYTYALEYNLEHPWLKDLKVRQALAQSINIPDIISKVDGGYGVSAPHGRGETSPAGVQSTGPFLPNTWSYNPDVKPLAYNPARALELLTEAGWQPNPSGVLEKDGREFRFTCLLDSEVRDAQPMARLVYQDLYKLGIIIDIKPFEYPKAGESPYQQIAAQAGAYLTTFATMVSPSDLARDWHSRSRNKSAKLWPYQNPEIDALLDSGRVAVNITLQQEIFRLLHRTLYADQPATFLYIHPHLAAVSARFSNTDALFSPAMPVWTIKDWKLATETQRERIR